MELVIRIVLVVRIVLIIRIVLIDEVESYRISWNLVESTFDN